MQSHKFNRRTLIKGTAAFSLSAVMSGCQAEQSSEAADQNRNAQLTAEDNGYRLFTVVPAVENFYSHLSELKPQPTMIFWGSRRRLVDPQEPAPPKPEFDYAVWATSDEAKALASEASVKSVTLIEPKHVVEIGEPDKAAGKLGVKLYPNSVGEHIERGPFASVDEVVKLWKQELSDVEGLVIKSVPTRKEPMAFGDVPEDGQIQIDFKGDKLNAKVLEVIKRHPQTLAIKWGSLFTYFYCPGCGMG